jgi:hypothetical protein
MGFGAEIKDFVNGFVAGRKMGMDEKQQEWKNQYLEWEMGFKEKDFERDRANEDRKFNLDERRVDIQERRVDAYEDRVKQQGSTGLSPAGEDVMRGLGFDTSPAPAPITEDEEKSVDEELADPISYRPGERGALPVENASLTSGGNQPSGADAWYNLLVERGVPPMQAAVSAGNVQQESGGRANAWNDKEGAGGALQWRLDRLDNLKRFAEERGSKWDDLGTQADFHVWESTEGPEARNARGFYQARTPEEANRALKGYIRYGDNSEGTRLANARKWLGGNAPAGAAPSSAYGQMAPGGGGGAPNPAGGERDYARMALMLEDEEPTYIPEEEERRPFEPLPLLFAADGGMVEQPASTWQAPTRAAIPMSAPMAATPPRPVRQPYTAPTQAIPSTPGPSTSSYQVNRDKYLQMLQRPAAPAPTPPVAPPDWETRLAEQQAAQDAMNKQIQALNTSRRFAHFVPGSTGQGGRTFTGNYNENGTPVFKYNPNNRGGRDR